MGIASAPTTSHSVRLLRFVREQIQTAIVTGANSGLGKESTYHLLQHGAHVVVACRNVKKGLLAIDDLKSRLPVEESAQWEYDVIALDLSSPRSIQQFVTELNSKLEHRARVAQRSGPPLAVDILMLNAAVFHVPFTVTDFGVEQHFAVNHVGNHMLARLLVQNLESAVELHGVATVTSVSSTAANAASSVGLSLSEINNHDGYNRPMWYATSKLANAAFTKKLATLWKVSTYFLPNRVAPPFPRNRAAQRGSIVVGCSLSAPCHVQDRGILVNLARPGSVHTGITRNLNPFLNFFVPYLPAMGIQWTVDQAVVTQVSALIHPCISLMNLSILP